MSTIASPRHADSTLAIPRRAHRHYLVDVWARFVRNRLSAASLVVLLVLLLGAAFAPLIAPSDPNAIDLRREMNLAAPSLAHPFGTDDSGRDWFSRALYGARVSLAVAFAAMLISTTIGTVVGSLAGYFGGTVDTVLMRLVEVLLSLPLFFLILIAQALLTPSIVNLMWVIGVTTWMNVSRIVRAEVMAIRETEYLQAAEAIGVPHRRRILRHVLPNATGPIIVAATLSVAYAILTEAALSYLGLGVPLPDPSWGNMLQKGLTRLQMAPWLVLFPGIMISITVLAFNFVGDGLRDAFDPLMKNR
ncbi:MAG: peptide/nickel transport system permease protein [Thermomicrobiales bacterium]|nr:peptide/nickel transport system permease protein [Thermomicrobiales bacterium]